MEEGEEDEEEEVAYEVIKPKKRIGRPPKVWSSILLPKEVTSTLGTRKPRLAKLQKSNVNTRSSNSNEGEATHSKFSTPNMVGQTVHGVVDGCFDAGFLVSLRMGDSDSLYRGVVFGPGLSIPVSKETDIAKNVKRRRRKRKLGTSTTTREEPSTPPPPPPAAPPREEAPPPNPPTIPQAPPHYEGPPTHAHHPNSVHVLENPHINPPIPPPHPHQFAYNGALHSNNFRSPRPHPAEMNVNPFMHSSGFLPRPSIAMPPAQGYSPHQNFGHVLPSPSTQYGYNFAGAQARPSTPLPPQYRGPADPQYRGP